jgi:hypothetical protein
VVVLQVLQVELVLVPQAVPALVPVVLVVVLVGP